MEGTTFTTMQPLLAPGLLAQKVCQSPGWELTPQCIASDSEPYFSDTRGQLLSPLKVAQDIQETGPLAGEPQATGLWQPWTLLFYCS